VDFSCFGANETGEFAFNSQSVIFTGTCSSLQHIYTQRFVLKDDLVIRRTISRISDANSLVRVTSPNSHHVTVGRLYGCAAMRHGTVHCHSDPHRNVT
jgi:hypothetical protein